MVALVGQSFLVEQIDLLVVEPFAIVVVVVVVHHLGLRGYRSFLRPSWNQQRRDR